MNTTTNRTEEVCQLARDMMSQIGELEDTLEIMQASLLEVIKQCSMPENEKREVLRILQKVSPAGLKSLLEKLHQTADRARLIKVEEYSQAAAALAATIYQQSGVAGPTSERTFTNKTDAATAAVREVAHPSLSNTREQYNKYLPKCPLLRVLTEGAKPGSPLYDALLWAQLCGYNTKNKETVEATIHHGLAAFIWNDAVVQEVTRMGHPSQGYVFLLKLDISASQRYNQSVGSSTPPPCCMQIDKDWALWMPKRYPLHAVVEVSTRLSRSCPFTRPREGWEAISTYLDAQYPVKRTPINNHHHESHNRPPSNARAVANAKLPAKASR